MQIDEKTIARAYGISPDGEVARTIARAMAAAPERIMTCPKCGKNVRIRNAKKEGKYKCASCDAFLNDTSASGEGADLVLEDGIPPEVKASMTNPDSVYGRYVIVSKLGEGAMGAVYKAYDVELSRYVALKFVKSERVEELKLEAKTLAAIEQKNIARLYDIGNDRGKGFIAMQLIRGRPLHQMDFTSAAALSVMQPICEAVDYAHKRGLIHRDLKPENIMIDDEGNVFVTDFGLATAKPAIGEFAGTPGYIAPEIAQGKLATSQCDIYSLGATLYYLISRKIPVAFKSYDRVSSVIAKISTGVYVPLREVYPDVRPEVEAIIDKALAAQPEMRYRTAAEMGEDIRNYLTGHPVTAYDGGAFYRFGKTLARNLRMTVAICIAVLAIGTVAWFIKSSSEKEIQRRESSYNTLKEATEHFIKGRKIIDESKSYLYKGYTADELPSEMEKWRSEISKGIREIESGLALVQGESKEAADAHYLIGRGYHYMGDLQRADDCYTKAIAKNPRHTGALLGRARLYVIFAIIERAGLDVSAKQKARSVIEHALDDYRRAESGDEYTDKSEIMIAAGYKTLLAEDFKGAISFADAKFKESHDEEFALLKGIAFMASGNYALSVEALNTTLAKRANFWEAYFWRSASEINLKDYAHAVPDADKAITINPNYSELYINRGNARGDTGDYDGAAQDIMRAIKLKPDYAEAYMNLGVNEGKRGDHKKELEHIDKALSLNPKMAHAYVLRGNALLTIGRPQDAVKEITKGLDLDPNHWVGFGLRAMVKYSMLDYQGAIDDANTSIKIHPENSQALAVLAATLMTMGKTDEARGYFEQAIKIDPPHADAFANYALLKINRKDYEGAITLCSRAIELNPYYAEAYYNRGMAKTSINDIAGAMSDYDNAIRLNPNNAKAYNNRGNLHHKRAEGALAIADYNKVMELDPTDPIPYLNRGMTHKEMNNLPAAIADYKKCLEMTPPNWPHRALAEKMLKESENHLRDY